MKQIFTVLALFTTISIFAQCPPGLEKYATGFDKLEASSFSFLNSELDKVKIVGYGESTHGTAEFTLLLEKLMEYLSKNHGFRILIIETGFGEGAYLNDYIQGVSDDLETIMNDHNTTWRYRTQEFYHLMNWLRSYNTNNRDKISIYGCEMQVPFAEVGRIEKYLQKVDSDYQLGGFEKHLWQQFSDGEKSDYYLSYFKAKRYFDKNRSDFIARSSEDEFNTGYHHIEVLGQFVSAINQHVEQRKHDFRDIYMEENISWILNSAGDDSKALYWAHNAHVGDWVANGNVDVTGHQLRKRYGEAYYNIATNFGTGDFVAYPHNADEIGWKMQTFSFEKVVPDTFTACMKEYGSPNTFLNLRKAKSDPTLKMKLEAPLAHTASVGAQHWGSRTETTELGKAFDAVLYLDKTHRINWAE